MEKLGASVITILGLALAYAVRNEYLGDGIIFTIAMVSLSLLVGISAYFVGLAQLPHAPVLAVRLMEGFSFVPLIAGVTAAALAVEAAIRLSVPSTSDAETKVVSQQLSGAITAMLSTLFVTKAVSDEDSIVSRAVRRAFQAKYKRHEPGQTKSPHVHYFPAESAGELLVYSDPVKGIQGWGRKARLRRAQGIARILAEK